MFISIGHFKPCPHTPLPTLPPAPTLAIQRLGPFTLLLPGFLGCPSLPLRLSLEERGYPPLPQAADKIQAEITEDRIPLPSLSFTPPTQRLLGSNGHFFLDYIGFDNIPLSPVLFTAHGHLPTQYPTLDSRAVSHHVSRWIR